MSEEFNGTPSQAPIKMNLQLFAEGDPVPTPTPAPEPTPNPEPTPGTSTPEPTPSPEPEPPKLKVKFNHEEKELTYDEWTQFAQKGMNYDKLQEKFQQLESNPALSWAEQQAKMYGFQTVEQYIEAVNKQQEQARLNELVQQNVPEEYAREMLENRKFREQYQAQQQEKQQQEKQQQEYRQFLEAYPDIKPDTIPPEVWAETQNGRSLVDAYRTHENSILKAKLSEYEQKSQTQQANVQNAQNSTGSLTGHGNVPNDFITKETFENNRHNQAWMAKNYDHLIKSMKKW